MSGCQFSGDAPTVYVRFASKIMEACPEKRSREDYRVSEFAGGAGLIASSAAAEANCRRRRQHTVR